MTDIQARARRGIKLLLGRQVVLQVLMLGGGIVLARVLDPAEFGLYAITTFLVALFSLFGEFGLAPSFIQRRDELTDRDLSVGFTLQQMVTTVVVAALFLLAPWLVSFYPQAPPDTIWLVRTLAFSLYLTSWRAMSALQLERHMRYERIVWVEVVENFSYQIIAVVLAVAGYGVWSFIWATMARGVLGTVLVFLVAPWRVRFGFDMKIVKEILRFGLPFQLQGIINQIVHWVTPTLVAVWVGPQAVGFLMWAVSNGRRPLILVDNVVRVAFPHFSRIQDDREAVERTLSQYLMLLLLVAGLWVAVLMIAGPMLLRWIYTEKWSPAIPALMIYAAGIAVDMIVWVMVVTLNGLGMVSFTTRYILGRNLAIVAVSIPLVLLIGFNGVPIGYLLMGTLSLPFVFLGFERGALRRILQPTAWIILPTLTSIILGSLTLKLPLPLVLHALLSACITGVLFVVAAWIFSPARFKQELIDQSSGWLFKMGLRTKWLVKRESQNIS